MATDSPATLLTAAHGFYQFAVPQDVFDRSLYYNLLLQPTIAIPDHYFLQSAGISEHLRRYRGRDSWIESGLRHGYIQPYFRREGASLSQLLDEMRGSDRRGFDSRAADIAERLGGTPFTSVPWSSSSNSRAFHYAFRRYMTTEHAPLLELRVDPDDFTGFWNRSREWIGDELRTATERSADLLGTKGLLLSQLIQVSGERLFGPDCERISSVDELLLLARTRIGPGAERDLRAYYTCACELYNRSLADTLLTAAGSPGWTHFVAAMDLWRDDILSPDEGDIPDGSEYDTTIHLPRIEHLRTVSGDVLTAIRRSDSCQRYFESLGKWRSSPTDRRKKGELVETLKRYSIEIRKQVGQPNVLGLRPRMIDTVSDLARMVERVPGVVQAFYVAAGSAAASAATGSLSPWVPAGFFSVLALQTIAKHRPSSQSVKLRMSASAGGRFHPDVTISRPLDTGAPTPRQA